MKRKWIPGAAVFLLAIAIGWMLRSEADAPPETSSSAAQSTTASDFLAVGDEPDQFRTRSADRPPPRPKATHGPQQLQRFFLGELDFTGLTLPEALEKVREAYVQTCALTGEVPLNLKFTLPPGPHPTLSFEANHSSVQTAVRLLAGINGMTVRRHGLEYRFHVIESFPQEERVSSATITKIRALSGGIDSDEPADPFNSPEPVSIERDFRKILENFGMKLDPSTRFTADGRIVSDNARDIAALSSLLVELRNLPYPPQQTLQSRVIELAPDAEWDAPDFRHLTEEQLRLEMRKLARIEGTTLQTLPSITTRPGHTAEIKIVRELLTPRGDEFDVHEVGRVVNLTAAPSGFGHQADIKFTDTTGELDPVTQEAEIKVKTSLSDSSYSSDAMHRVLVETRPDGSRAVMFSKLQLLDPTGRPFADHDE